MPDGENPFEYVPPRYYGEIPPNHYCREWQPISPDGPGYCRLRAGQGTDHVGEGRCREHDVTVGLAPRVSKPPSAVRRLLREAATERIKVLEEIADNPDAKDADRRGAIETLLRYGIGLQDNQTVVSAEVISRLNSQSARFIAELSPDALAIVKRITDEVWR